MSQSIPIPLPQWANSNNHIQPQYSSPVSNSRTNNHMMNSQKSQEPHLFIFTNPNIFSPPIASLKTELKKHNIIFEIISNANNLGKLVNDNKENCLVVIESPRQSATDISCIFPENFNFPKSTPKVNIITYPNQIANTMFQVAPSPSQVLALYKKNVQPSQANRIRLKKVHSSKDIKFEQAPINSIRQANSLVKTAQQFFQKLYFYNPPNQTDANYKLLVESLRFIEGVYPFSKLQQVTTAAKQLKKQNKILALVSHDQAPVLKRHIEYMKKQKQVQFMIFGIDQPRKQLMSTNMYFASNDPFQIIDELSKIGFSRMFDCRRKYEQLSTGKKTFKNQQQNQLNHNNFTSSKFSRPELNRISQRSGASIFSNASSQQQRYVRNWIVDKDTNDQYQMIEQNKQEWDLPPNQISRRTSISNRSRMKSQQFQNGLAINSKNNDQNRRSLQGGSIKYTNSEFVAHTPTKTNQEVYHSSINGNNNISNDQKNVKKIVKITKKDASISNISSNQNIGKHSYQQMPSNVIQQTSEQYRGSNRQSIVHMDDNFYTCQGAHQPSNNLIQSGTNLTNSNHHIQQNSGIDKTNTGSGFNKVKISTQLQPISQQVQKKKITYTSNYRVPSQSKYIASSEFIIPGSQRQSNEKLPIESPSQKMVHTISNQNVYSNMSMAPKIINGLTGQLQQIQSRSRAPLLINGLTGQLYPTQVLRISNGSHQQDVNAKFYSPTHVVRNQKISPQQVRMPSSSTSTNEMGQSNQYIQNTVNNNRNTYSSSNNRGTQIKKAVIEQSSSTSIRQHVTSNNYIQPSSSSSNYRLISTSNNNNNNNADSYNSPSYSNSKNNNQNSYQYSTSSYRNNAGIYNIPSTTNNVNGNNARYLTTTTTNPVQKTTYVEKKTYNTNTNSNSHGLAVEDQDPFHQNSNNKSKLKGSYMKRQIDGKLDPFSPYEGSGIKVVHVSPEPHTKITYLNGTSAYQRNQVSPYKYDVYEVSDKKITTNAPSTSNFNIYNGINHATSALQSQPTQIKRIVIGVDGVRRQTTVKNNNYMTGQQQQQSTNAKTSYDRANMVVSPVREVRAEQNKYVSPGKVNVNTVGGYSSYTGIYLDQYEAHVDENGRTIYKKKSIGILGENSKINTNVSNSQSLRRYEPSRRQYTNSPTRREEVKYSAFRRVSLQKPTQTINSYNRSPQIRAYDAKNYQSYNQDGYIVKKHVHQVGKYEESQSKPITYGNNYNTYNSHNSLKQSSDSIKPLVYDARSPTKVQTYRGDKITTYQSPRRHVVQRKQYTQPKVQSSNFNHRIDKQEIKNQKSKEKPIKNNQSNQKLKQKLKQTQKAKEKINDNNDKWKINNKVAAKVNTNVNSNEAKKSQIYEPSDASIMRRNNNKFGVNLYKRTKKIDESFQLNELKSKIKSKIFTLSDLNKKMMINRIIEDEKQIQQEKKKFSYIDTGVNYFHFLIDQEIGHLKQWVQSYILAQNDKLQTFRGIEDLYQKASMANDDEYYSQNDIGFILATSEEIAKINKNLLPQNYFIIDLISPVIFNGIQISQLDKKVKLSKLSNLKLVQKIILQSKLNHILLYPKKMQNSNKNNLAYQKQIQQILNIFPDEEFIKQFYEGEITGDLMDGLIDDFRFNRLYIICDEKQMQNIINQLDKLQKQEGFPKNICKIICLPNDNQILKYENLIQKHPEVAWITNVSKINDYKSLMKYAFKQSQDERQKQKDQVLFEKEKIFFHVRHKNLQQILEKEFPGRFVLESFTSLVDVQKKIVKSASKTLKNNSITSSSSSNYLILHPILSQEYINPKLYKKIFMLGKSDKIQRKVVRVSTNAQLIQLLKE